MRVAVQQRQRLFREGIGQLLMAEDDIEVVGTAGTSTELMALCHEHRPDVAILEADAIEWEAGRLAGALTRSVPGLRVIGLTTGALSEPDMARTRRSGIRDVLPRSAGIGRIIETLRSPSRLMQLRPASVPRRPPAAPAQVVLTARELTVLQLVGAGFTSREIAVQLGISHKTVENYKQRVFAKLGVQNQAHAVSVAMRRGIMRPERVISLAMAD